MSTRSAWGIFKNEKIILIDFRYIVSAVDSAGQIICLFNLRAIEFIFNRNSSDPRVAEN